MHCKEPEPLQALQESDLLLFSLTSHQLTGVLLQAKSASEQRIRQLLWWA